MVGAEGSVAAQVHVAQRRVRAVQVVVLQRVGLEALLCDLVCRAEAPDVAARMVSHRGTRDVGEPPRLPHLALGFRDWRELRATEALRVASLRACSTHSKVVDELAES